MADNILRTRLISAYNTLDYWSTATTIPLGGEVCYAVDDDNKILEIKIGDGIHKYSELPTQSFDSEDHLYKLSTPASTAADATNFSATTYLQVNNGAGGSSYSNASSAVLTIPAATTSKAGVLTASDKKIVDAAADTRLTGGTTGSTAAGNAYVTVNTKTVSSAGATSTGTSTLKVDGLGTMAFESSADFVSVVTTAAYNTNGVTIKQTKGGTASTVANFGSAAKSNIVTSIGSSPASSSTNVPTDYAVWKAIDDLPEPMIFKGSVGTDGTTASLPTTGLSTYEGWTYKVITDGTYGGVTAEVGDSLICNGTEWVLIPSGDEPSGTVTSVGVSSTATDSPLSVTGSPITSSGTIDIEHAAGNTTTAKYGATAAKSGLGGTVNVPFIQADKYGHVTSAGHFKFTAPTEAQVKAVKVNNASSADNADYATSAGDSAKLNGVDASNFLQADDISAGTGITVTTAAGASTVSADLATTVKYNGAAATVTAAQSTAVANRVYAIQPDKNGDLAVYVPWSNTQDGHTYLKSDQFTNTPASASVKLGIQTSGTSAAKAETTIAAASTSQAGVMTTAQVATLNKVVSATSAVEGITKKPSGTAPISVDANNVISLDDSGVSAGTYGASANVPVITVDAKGRVTSATTVAVKDTTYSASASDRIALSGTTFYHTTAITAGKTVTNTASTADTWGESVSFSVPEISYDKWGHTTAVTSKAFKVSIPASSAFNYTISADNEAIKLYRNGTLASSASTVSTDLLRNGVNTLILNGNFTTA